MTRNEQKAKARWEYVSERLCNSDYPIYNEEHELESAFDAGSEWADAHPDNGLNFEPKSLEECIEAATPTWRGVDVDAYLDEERGREPSDRWISIDDALPEVYEPVLAAAGNHFVVVAIRDNFDWYDSKFDGEKISGITHWQRLPAPPKKGGN